MSTISNDKQFAEALSGLTPEQQRAVGAAFVENVVQLTDDARVAQALAAARDANIEGDALALVRHNIKAAILEAHTRCGADGNWSTQAGYFVARAAEACVEDNPRSKGKNPAWKAAMSARMAKTCLAAESDEDSHDSESQAQYNILTSYLDA